MTVYGIREALRELRYLQAVRVRTEGLLWRPLGSGQGCASRARGECGQRQRKKATLFHGRDLGARRHISKTD
jgi:hypothetical protein